MSDQDTLPTGLLPYLDLQGWGAPVSVDPLGGGCVSETWRLRFTDGRSLFAKGQRGAPEDLFSAEAEGLRALREAAALRVPEVVTAQSSFLLLEDLPPGDRSRDFSERLGRGLAQLHERLGPHFGYPIDTYCGGTRQPNEAREDGYEFFAERRLGSLTRACRDSGLLSPADVRAVDHLCDRLDDLIPPQPPSLLHGDLWSGNVHTAPDGLPALIDPAVYWGWAEIDLAMTALFGGFDEAFYAAYHAARPLEQGWRQRLPIYNLYPLLNHLLLFGRSYLGQVRATLRPF